MKICQDVIRKHARVPRSYKEATGQFYRHEEPYQFETWAWRVIIGAGYVVCLLVLVGAWK